MNLLIVEDHGSMMEILTEFAGSRAQAAKVKVAVLQAKTLTEALKLLPSADAVLCDGHFPDTDGGIPVCNWQVVSDLAAAREIPFVLLTADDDLFSLASLHGVIAWSKDCSMAPDGTFPPIDILIRAAALKAKETQPCPSQ